MLVTDPELPDKAFLTSYSAEDLLQLLGIGRANLRNGGALLEMEKDGFCRYRHD